MYIDHKSPFGLRFFVSIIAHPGLMHPLSDFSLWFEITTGLGGYLYYLGMVVIISILLFVNGDCLTGFSQPLPFFWYLTWGVASVIKSAHLGDSTTLKCSLLCVEGFSAEEAHFHQLVFKEWAFYSFFLILYTDSHTHTHTHL